MPRLARAESAERREDPRREQRRSGTPRARRGWHRRAWPARQPPRCTGCRILFNTVEDHDDNTHAVRRDRPQAVSGQRRRQDLGARVAPAAEGPGCSAALARAARTPRRQHDAHRVAAVAHARSGTTCSSWISTATPTTSPFARRSTRSKPSRHLFKVLGSLPESHPLTVQRTVAQHPNRFRAVPTKHIGGRITVPGDKSISHRALMLGAIADRPDARSRFSRERRLPRNASSARGDGRRYRTYAGGARARSKASGSAACAPPSKSARPRQLGHGDSVADWVLLAGQAFDSELTGDASLQQRPMERVAAPLRHMGARITTSAGGTAARHASPAARTLRGIDYELPIASAQVKSALLLAALSANGHHDRALAGPEPRSHRTHARRAWACSSAWRKTARGISVTLNGPAALRGLDIDVPADFSLRGILSRRRLSRRTRRLADQERRHQSDATGLLDDPARDGRGDRAAQRAQRRRRARRGLVGAAERAAEASPCHPSSCRSRSTSSRFCSSPRRLRSVRRRVSGADELRKKETDRIAVMAQGLDGRRRRGRRNSRTARVIVGGRIRGGTVDSRGDHRIAMSFAVASLTASEPIEILNTAEVATSFPNFLEIASAVGSAGRTSGAS